MSDLEDVWKELDDDPASAPGLLLRRVDLPGFHVYLAHERPSRLPAFLVKIKDDPGNLWKDLRQSQGLDVRIEARPGQEPSLLIVERDARFHEILAALVSDLLKGLHDVATLPPEERPLTLDFLVGRISRWQACLQANRDGLSSEKAAGLFGELSTLARLLDAGVDPVLTVTRWTGPSNAIQDFQFAQLTLEIKASRQTQPTNVRISSERQLDTTDHQRLLLIHYGLDERSDASGCSLPQKVAELRDALGGSHAGMLFDDRLIDYGYLEMHAARYADRSYTIRQVDHFDVRDPMPRITEADLPVGVGQVSYDLALAGCEPFRIGAGEVDALFFDGPVVTTPADGDFLAELQRRVLSDAERGDEIQAVAFTDYMRQVLTDAGELDDGETALFHTEGPKGMSASGFAISDDGEVVDLLVTDYEPTLQVRSLTKTPLGKPFAAVHRFASQVEQLAQVLEPAFPAYSMCTALAEGLPRAERIRITLFTNARVRISPPPAEPLHSARVTHHIWDLDRLFRLERSGRAREPITIDLAALTGGPLPALGPKGVPGDYEAYLLLVPGRVLADIYEEHGPRLLELNVRSFLQARGKVNQGIQRTIRSEPHRFLAYNNGVSMTASSVELADDGNGGAGIVRIHDLQIVNGGQTTASLHHARSKPRRDDSLLDGIHVQAKLSVVPEDNLMDLVPRISEYANSQNTVKTADFSANHPFHIELQRLSRSTLAPAADGSQRSTRWFYERARGQYADAVANRRTAADQKEFKAENPPSQVIRKTDLAKFELAWAQRPDLVSFGAEKTFREFMLRLGERPDFTPDASYFEQLVAKAVLFQQTETTIRDLKLGGYKSQTVAYTVALVSKRTAQQIDLGRIWKDQDIPEVLRSSLHELAPSIHATLIASAGTGNVAEWAKKDGAWQAVQAIDWQPDERLIAKVQPRGGLHLEERWTPEAKEAALRVYALNQTGWQALLEWGTTTKNLDAAQRKTCRALRDMNVKGTLPTPGIMLLGAEILDLAESVGFTGF